MTAAIISLLGEVLPDPEAEPETEPEAEPGTDPEPGEVKAGAAATCAIDDLREELRPTPGTGVVAKRRPSSGLR